MTESDRLYPSQPIVGVGVVVWRKGRVLLVRRARPPKAGQWALPGGRQELGETLFAAATREVAEETGITIAPSHVITALDLIEKDDAGIRYHYTLVEIAAEYLAGEVVAGDDAAAAAWFTPKEVAALETWSEVLRVIFLSRDAHSAIDRV